MNKFVSFPTSITPPSKAPAYAYKREDRAVYLYVKDYKTVFEDLSYPPLYVNNFDITVSEDRQELNRLLMTRYDGDCLSPIPKCDCGKLKTEAKVGKRCGICFTEVRAITERRLESNLWMKPPDGIVALVHPQMWIILSEAMTSLKVNCLMWLCDPYYKPKSVTEGLRRLMALEIPRGMNHFIRNFDEIFERIYAEKGIIKINDQQGRKDLYEYVRENRHKLFPEHLPFPSKLCFVAERSSGITYADTSMTEAINPARAISSLSTGIIPVNLRTKESRTIRALEQLALYYSSYAGKPSGAKPGIIRKHIVGSRSHFTARAVISSITEAHNHDECLLPWSLSVLLLKLHLTNLLDKMGKSPNEINKLIHESVNRYDPLIDALFDQLLGSGHGVWIILQRNPSLKRASAQCLRVSGIRKDPTVNTIGLSVLCLRGPNADFDGDELNVTLILDEYHLDAAKRLLPYLSFMDLKTPWAASKNSEIPAPVISTINIFRKGTRGLTKR